jgi:hypothetical protein
VKRFARPGGGLRHLDDLERAGPVRQAPDEAALLERRDQAVDARLRLEIERVLHLVEGRGHAGVLHPLVDEVEKFMLFARQHGADPSRGLRGERFRKQSKNMVVVPAVFRKQRA